MDVVHVGLQVYDACWCCYMQRNRAVEVAAELGRPQPAQMLAPARLTKAVQAGAASSGAAGSASIQQ